MFKGMPKVFWIGMAVMYGWCFLFMILEMIIPGLPLKPLLGVPACYIYNLVIALWIIPIIVSYLFFSLEEAREKRNSQAKGGN